MRILIARLAITYLDSRGIAEDAARKFVAEVIRAGGPGTLQLDDRFARRDAFVAAETPAP